MGAAILCRCCSRRRKQTATRQSWAFLAVVQGVGEFSNSKRSYAAAMTIRGVQEVRGPLPSIERTEAKQHLEAPFVCDRNDNRSEDRGILPDSSSRISRPSVPTLRPHGDNVPVLPPVRWCRIKGPHEVKLSPADALSCLRRHLSPLLPYHLLPTTTARKHAWSQRPSKGETYSRSRETSRGMRPASF